MSEMTIDDTLKQLRGRCLALLYNDDAKALRQAILYLERVKRLEVLIARDGNREKLSSYWVGYVNGQDKIMEFLRTGKEW